jgi:hypothetical protein
MRIVHIAVASAVLAGAAPVLVACDDDKTIRGQLDEATEEIGDEIDDHTDDD